MFDIPVAGTHAHSWVMNFKDEYTAFMEYAKIYPGYDFEKNKGYGTKNHLKALDEIGITPIHRKTYEPIKTMLLPTLF